MKIAYQNENVTLWHGDSLSTDHETDVLFTDPPYGELGYDWDKRPPWATLPVKCSCAVIFGHQPHMAREVLPAFEQRGLPFRYEWIWEKPIGRLWNHSRPIRKHELAWVFGSIEGSDLRQGFGGQHDSIISAMTFQAYCRAHPEAEGHPTQKPLVLVSAMLRSLPPGRVLDPFAGTGTTLIACLEQGRPCVGIEIDERWVEVARRRLERWHAQGRLDFGTANAKVS